MLVRWDPFRDFDRVSEELLAGNRTQRMPMDAYRHGDEFVVQLDLPGVDDDKIDVTMDGDTLTVKAERHSTYVEDDECLASERRHGAFQRQLILGESLDRDKLVAKYDRGVLTITIPVAEAAKPRRVAIERAGATKEIHAAA